MPDISDEIVEKAAKAAFWTAFCAKDSIMRDHDDYWRRAAKDLWRDVAREALAVVYHDLIAAENEACAQIVDAIAQLSNAKFEGVVKKAGRGENNLELAGAVAIGMCHAAQNGANAIRARCRSIKKD